MKFENELIVVILNEGYSDTVMDAARAAGAGGGTVLHAKGTGHKKAVKFFGVSLAEEKDMIYIVSPASRKAKIMNAIEKAAGYLIWFIFRISASETVMISVFCLV